MIFGLPFSANPHPPKPPSPAYGRGVSNPQGKAREIREAPQRDVPGLAEFFAVFEGQDLRDLRELRGQLVSGSMSPTCSMFGKA